MCLTQSHTTSLGLHASLKFGMKACYGTLTLSLHIIVDVFQSRTALFRQHRFEFGNKSSLQHSESSRSLSPKPFWHSSVAISSSRLPSTILDKALPLLV